jgi:very-short-patch-repair endonuclease
MPWAAESAALLAMGQGAVLSHASAAAVWGIYERPLDRVSVTVVGRHARVRRGIELHCLRALPDLDRAVRHRLAVTAPARTMIDLAASISQTELERVLDAGWAARLLTEPELASALARTPGNHPGAAAVRAFLGSEGPNGFTRSRAERKLRSLLRAADLPQPLINVDLDGLLVDFYWQERGVVLEVDGFQFHGSRTAFERDRRRDQQLAARGLVVIRITWWQLENEPMAVIARLAQALASRAA